MLGTNRKKAIDRWDKPCERKPPDLLSNLHKRRIDLLLLSEEEFREKFKNSPVKRAKRRGLLRSVATALAASDDPEAELALEHAAAQDSEPLVQEHSERAWEQIRMRKL